MEYRRLVLGAACGLLLAGPAVAASFGELVEWCAPEDAGGRPGLCSGYLETYLPALASSDASLNDGVRACVPETTDRAEIRAMIQDYAREHPEAANEPGVLGLGRVLKDRYPCSG
jgi:hypothetical protein